MRRKLLTGAGVILIAMAWLGARLMGDSGEPVPTSTPLAVVPTGGDALAPLDGMPFVFDRVPRPVAVREASITLAGVVRGHPLLLVQALPSTEGTAAVFLQEQSNRPEWGRLLIPAEREIFRAFADDPAMGEWLVVMVDVFVPGARDPVPLTGYRWDRPGVESYARCGIPEREVEECTLVFFGSARTVIFAPHARLRRGI